MAINAVTSKYHKYKSNGTLYVIVLCLIASLTHLANGNGNGWPSAALPDINEHVNPFHLTPDEMEWTSSINHLSAIPGGLLAGPVSEYFGRKPAMLIVCLPYALSWVIITAATNVYVLYAGRIVLGIAQGLAAGVCTVYLVEVAPTKIRGGLAAFGDIGYSAGKLYDYAFGCFLSWNWLAVTNIGVASFTAICVYFIPETPRWLIATSNSKPGHWKKDEAEKILKQLRGGKEADVSEELKEIEESVSKGSDNVPWTEFLKKKHSIHLAISLIIIMVFQLGGAIVVTQYTVPIFDAAHSSMDPHLQTVIVGIMDVVGAILCTFTVDYFGRRIMLLFSTFSMAFFISALGVYFYVLAEVDPFYAEQHLSWLPLLSLICFELFENTGIGAIIWMMPSELFPTEMRSRALSIAVAFSHTCQFLSAKYFGHVVRHIGVYTGFWICGAIDLCGVIFFFFCVPETGNKTLEEIQNEE